jgi:hypothetical protein
MKSFVLLISVFALLVVCGGIAQAKWQQKEFIVTMWCPPPATEENMAILARDHYTLTGVGTEGDRMNSGANLVAQLDIAQKHGIKALVFNPLLHFSSLDDPTKKAELDALIDLVKNHPAMDGYHITDEPSATTFPNWKRIVNYLKERDPDHLAYINLFPTYANQQQLGVNLVEVPTGPLGYPDNFAGIGANNKTVEFYNEHLRQYIEQIKPEIISYDHYHFLNNGVDGQQYFLNLALIRNAALKTNVPFLNIVQACTIEKSWRLVNAEEMRWLTFTTMAYGGRGLSWFLYWGPVSYGGMYQEGKRMPLADFGAEINKDIAVIGPELLKLESTDVYQTAPLPLGAVAFPENSPAQITEGDFILGLFKEKDKVNAFMVVNRDYKNKATAEVTLNFGNGKLWVFSRTKSKWGKLQAVKNGTTINVPLNPGDGQLYKVTK